MTVRRFAERRQWAIEKMEARLVLHEAAGAITAVDVELVIEGDLDAEQRERLHEVATTCRVSKALSGAVPVNLR